MKQIVNLPDLPKDIARKIRTAQEKVLDERDRVRHAEKRIIEDTAEMEFYDRDPRGWADKNYGSHMELNSYPVLTRSSRIREALVERIERRPVRALALRDAERELDRIEKEAFVRVSAMRPGNGRVTWPATLPSFKGYGQVLDTGEEAVAQADANMAKAAMAATAWFAERNDDGVAPGEGSEEALAARRTAWQRSPTMHTGQLIMGDGTAFRVTAWSKEQVSAMQRVIDEDQSRGIVGNIWNLACGIVLTGCDWIGFQEWRDGVASPVRPLLVDDGPRDPAKSLSSLKVAENARYDRIRAALLGRYLPEELANVESFVTGSNAMPSRLFRFWKEQGFSEGIARNWFLKSQPHTWAFRSDNNSFGPETWKAMRNTGQVLEGTDVPLDRGIAEFKLQPLMSALATLGMNSSRIVTECRAALLAHPDPGAVKAALMPHGYLQLQGVKPPLGLAWSEFQSWRMQIRGMAGVLTDLYFDKVPREERRILLQ